jgi:hypothetical protein
MPPRGYWAKLAAGQVVEKPDLPRRTPGMSDRVVVGRSQRRAWDDEPAWLTEPDPPVPEFPESLDDVEARVRKHIGYVRRTTDLADAHTRIQALLTEDERRREKLNDTPWNKPRFENAFEQRRLRILSSLCRALDRVDVRFFIRGEIARDLAAHVGDRT